MWGKCRRRGQGQQLKRGRTLDNLLKKQVDARYMNFPDRSSEIGGVISSYLSSKKNLPDEAIHLLFSANRWEKLEVIKKLLQNGTTLIVDRYCYSGVAYSVAKGLDLEWCKRPDVGLPQPDQVFFLTMPLTNLENRKDFGIERYEVLDMQKKVAAAYSELKDDSWEVIDADRPIEQIQNELFKTSLDVVNRIGNEAIGKLWTK